MNKKIKCPTCGGKGEIEKEVINLTESGIQKREIEWYRKFGKYPERIKRSSSGELYMIGDFSWNRASADKTEYVERRMEQSGVYK